MVKTPSKKGYTVLDKVAVDEQKHRELPNSDPAKDDNMSYQEQPWQEKTKW